jgi:AcrR family transcriptional regulator
MFEALLVAYAASQDETKPPQQRFRAGLRAYVDFALSRPDEYRLTFDWKAANPCAEADAATKSFDMLQQHVGAMMQAGLFRTNDTLLVAEALWACLHGVAMLLINQADHVESDHDRLIDSVIDAAMRGFGT